MPDNKDTETERQRLAKVWRTRSPAYLTLISKAYRASEDEAYRAEVLPSDSKRRDHFLRRELRKLGIENASLNQRPITAKQARIAHYMVKLGSYGGIDGNTNFQLSSEYDGTKPLDFLAEPSTEKDMEKLREEYDSRNFGGNPAFSGGDSKLALILND